MDPNAVLTKQPHKDKLEKVNCNKYPFIIKCATADFKIRFRKCNTVPRRIITSLSVQPRILVPIWLWLAINLPSPFMVQDLRT